MRWMMALVMVSGTLFSALTAIAAPIALYINFGDHGQLDAEMRATGERARVIFPRLGYKFGLLAPGADIRQRIESALQVIAAEHPEELVIVTHGHGEIVGALSDQRRFPAIATRPGPYMTDPLSFVFMNGRSRGDEPAGSAEFQNIHIGVGDFQKWIADFRAQNPTAPVRMIIAECYGGSAIRLLNQIPGVLAFSGASDHEQAHLQKDSNGKKVAFVDYYLEEIARGGRLVTADRELAVFESARAKWMQLSAKFDVRLAEVPWSPVDARINSWCVKPATSAPASLAPGLERLKKSSERTLVYEGRAGAVYRGWQKCDKNPGKLRLHREGYALAVDAWAAVVAEFKTRVHALTLSDFAKMRDELAQTPPNAVDGELREVVQRVSSSADLGNFIHETEENLDRSLMCYRTSQAAVCGRLARGYVLGELTGNQGMMDDRLKKNCAYETDQNIAPCLKDLKKIVPERLALAAESIQRMLSRTIEYAFENCSRQREEYYRACYDRFWQNADARTLEELARDF